MKILLEYHIYRLQGALNFIKLDLLLNIILKTQLFK